MSKLFNHTEPISTSANEGINSCSLKVTVRVKYSNAGEMLSSVPQDLGQAAPRWPNDLHLPVFTPLGILSPFFRLDTDLLPGNRM